MNSRTNHNFTRWLALWAALVIGHLAAILVFPGEIAFGVHSFAEILGVVLLPLSAVVYAAIGPLSMICFIFFLFRVQGGTLTAIASLILGSMLIYPALIWLLRIWLRTEKSLVRRLGWLFCWVMQRWPLIASCMFHHTCKLLLYAAIVDMKSFL